MDLKTELEKEHLNVITQKNDAVIVRLSLEYFNFYHSNSENVFE